MSKLNKDILFLLFKELQSDSKSLFSCSLVNRLWCETAIQILWRNPWCYENDINYQKKGSLYHIIISSLPNNVKEFLTNQGIKLFPTSTSYQSFLFDYLSFCRSINMKVMKVIKNIVSLVLLQLMINSFYKKRFINLL